MDGLLTITYTYVDLRNISVSMEQFSNSLGT